MLSPPTDLANTSWQVGLAGLSTRLTSTICPSIMRPLAALLSRTTRGPLIPIENPLRTFASTFLIEVGSTI